MKIFTGVVSLVALSIAASASPTIADVSPFPHTFYSSDAGERKERRRVRPMRRLASLGTHSMTDLSGYFAHPLPGAWRVRGVHAGHAGVDLAAPTGTPVRAAAAGVVSVANHDPRAARGGKYVIVKHDNNTETFYGHLSSISVSVGSVVAAGEELGGVGSTGYSTGPHLHFEVRGGRNPF